MKIDRLLGILIQLINKDKVTAKELAEHFEVSVRTIQRDMDTLNMAGIPLYADVGKNGGYALLDNFKLNRSFLNRNEANILIKFLENLDRIGASKEIHSIYNKFQLTNDTDQTDDKLIIKMDPWVSEDYFKNKLTHLSSARDSLNKVHIKYYDLHLNETSRVFNPYTLLMLGTVWYVYGYCELRSDFRLLKISRIISVEILNEHFEKLKTPDHKPWESVSHVLENQERIIFKLDKCLLGKIPDHFDYIDCEVKDDHILVTLDYRIDEWLFSVLLAYVPNIEILEPAHLRESFIQKLKKGIAKNSYYDI